MGGYTQKLSKLLTRISRLKEIEQFITDFLTAFLQNGTTMRGFYQSYQSKCLMKDGMKETDLIDWRTWHTACVEFLEKIMNIGKKEIMMMMISPLQPKALLTSEFILTYRRVLSIQTNPYQALS